MSIVPADVVEVKLSRGLVSIIDAEDAEKVCQHKWYAHWGKNAYYARSGGNKAILLHRFILGAPRGTQVDHINGDGLDNRKANLRFCTPSQNKHNGRKYRSSGGRCYSVFKGVSFYKGHRFPWRATVTINGERHMRSFATELAAAMGYDELARQYCGEFAKTNFQ